AFRAFWASESSDASLGVVEPDVQSIVVAFDAEGDHATDGDDVEIDAPVLAVRWSPTEVLRQRDFASYTSAEFAEARVLMADMRLAGALKRSRRHRPS